MNSCCNNRARNHRFDEDLLLSNHHFWFNRETALKVDYCLEKMGDFWFYLFDFGLADLAEVFEFGFNLGSYSIRTSYSPGESRENIRFERLIAIEHDHNELDIPLEHPGVVDAYVKSYNSLPLPSVFVEEASPGTFRFRFPKKCFGEVFLFAVNLRHRHQRAKQFENKGLDQVYFPVTLEQVSSFWETNSGLDLKTCSFAEYEAWLEENLPEDDELGPQT